MAQAAPRGVDAGLSAAAGGLRLAQQAPVSLGQRRIAEDGAGGGNVAVAQVHRGGTGPFRQEQVADRGDGVADVVDQRVAVTGKFDRRSEEHTSELQSLMRISYAVFCLKKKNRHKKHLRNTRT